MHIENTLLDIIQERVKMPLSLIQLLINIISFVKVIKMGFKIRSGSYRLL
jgi:hypothetical protein